MKTMEEKMSLLTDKQIDDALIELNGWEYQNGSICKTITFDSYMESIGFINRLAEKAEELNHHPDMVVGWCKINLVFTSHDQGGITLGCIEMAKNADSVL
tara:strand:- start:689 stop:988 length:300 start_codon:yes stop_codon:yes gene_type:complete